MIAPRPSTGAPDLILDLDGTLFEATHVLAEVRVRMVSWIARRLGVSAEEADRLRVAYFERYGATVGGLVVEHGLDADDFLEDVHQVSFASVRPDAILRTELQQRPGRRIVFTNAARPYAMAVLQRLDVLDLMDGVFTIEDSGLSPKPSRQAFERLIARFGVDPARAIFFDDHAANLVTAKDLGFATCHVAPGASAGDAADFAAADLVAALQVAAPNAQALTPT